MGKRTRWEGKIRPNERLYKILGNIGLRGAMTEEMIYDIEFRGKAAIRTCQDKLYQWERAKLIKSATTEARGKCEKVYMLTDKGRVMFDEEARRHFYKSDPTPNEMKHVLNFNDYVNALEDKVVGLINERELRSVDRKKNEDEQDPEVTDGYIVVSNGKGISAGCFIEIDSGDCGVRLAKKCDGLKSSGKPTKVVVYDKARKQAWAKALGKADNVEVVLFEKTYEKIPAR